MGSPASPGVGEGGRPVIRKGTGGEDGYSVRGGRPAVGETASTGLAEMLRADGRRRVVVTGLALDYCVKGHTLDVADDRDRVWTPPVSDIRRSPGWVSVGAGVGGRWGSNLTNWGGGSVFRTSGRLA